MFTLAALGAWRRALGDLAIRERGDELRLRLPVAGVAFGGARRIPFGVPGRGYVHIDG